jgi:DNA-binding GntR family transcriptional regulator
MKLELNIDEYLPLREVVFRTLRQAIIQGEFQPGERLMEESLANKLGVSRTPVREAIRMLELEGLVVMIPRRGAEVAKITVKDLRDALEVRMSLEALSVRLACERIDEAGKEQLIEASMQFKEAINSKLVPAIVEGDERFHDVIFSTTNNQRLITIAQNLREQVYRYRVEYVKDFSYHDKLVREHDQITRAILTRDAETAEQIMKSHIYNQEQIVIKNISADDK